MDRLLAEERAAATFFLYRSAAYISVRRTMMNQLNFYVGEKQHHAGMPLYEWLLEEARGLGIHGGSAFRAIAGFGRHGRLHEDTFFELAGELAVKVEFILDDAIAEQMMQRVRAQSLNIFYVRCAVQAGVI
jgi:PII-like signaling protein